MKRASLPWHPEVMDALLCSTCMAEGTLRRLRWFPPCDWWECARHGAQITGHFVWSLARV